MRIGRERSVRILARFVIAENKIAETRTFDSEMFRCKRSIVANVKLLHYHVHGG